MRLAILLLLLITSPAFAQVTLETEPFSGVLAKSVKVEPTANGVLVLMTERVGEVSGVWLKITSTAKWVTPYSEGAEIGQSTTPGLWYMIAKPGKYSVLLIEFDPDKGPRITSRSVTIGTGTNPQPPPVVGDMAQLTKASKDAADALSDPPTRKALATAYRTALAAMTGKTYDECTAMAKQARFNALNARTGLSRSKDWASWLTAVDAVLGQLVKPGDADAYRAAIAAIATGLE